MKSQDRLKLEQGLQSLVAEWGEPSWCRPVDQAAALLERFADEISLLNPKFGLVEAAEADLVTKHMLDCAAGALWVARALEEKTGAERAVADIGSGAGLPGLVLAILMPETTFKLVEPAGRRASFLLSSSAVLGLKNVAVFPRQLSELRDQFLVVTFRAFKPLDRAWYKALSRVCHSAGHLLAYKGRRERVQEELASLGAICPESRIEPLLVPMLDEERHMLIMKPAAPEA